VNKQLWIPGSLAKGASARDDGARLFDAKPESRSRYGDLTFSGALFAPGVIRFEQSLIERK
jgi:hypothetical protein